MSAEAAGRFRASGKFVLNASPLAGATGLAKLQVAQNKVRAAAVRICMAQSRAPPPIFGTYPPSGSKTSNRNPQQTLFQNYRSSPRAVQPKGRVAL